MYSRNLLALINTIEDEIQSFYGFKKQTEAVNHLISSEELLLQIPHLEENQLKEQRAAVYVQNHQGVEKDLNEEVFIGLYISEKILDQVSSHNPLNEINLKSLDSLCVFIEELSHFHLLINRAIQSLPVTQLELETQGEIDKVLFSSLFLKEQCGDPHLTELSRLIYDQAKLFDSNSALYEEANKHAASFWFGVIDRLRIRDPSSDLLVEHLRKNYSRSLADKLFYNKKILRAS